MGKITRGVIVGAAAGVIDVIPMLLQGLPWNADVSAFLAWLSIGILVSITEIKMNPILKGIFIACLIVVPHMFIIGAAEPFSLIPVAMMTLILGSFAGYMNAWLESRDTFNF